MASKVEQQQRQQAASNRYNAELYERIRVLGQGSFGTAIVHRRQADGALVVLKEIDLRKLKQDADKLAMVIQEARIMSKLSHPNIIQYYNAYTRDNSKLVIEMEYARIGTLQTYLSLQTRPLDELEVLAIFRQILAGLEYLHSKSIVHLDLKMVNIFVTSEGSVKIGDFGIARLMSRPQDEQQQQQQVGNGANQLAATGARPRLASVGARAASASPTGPTAAAAAADDSAQHYCQLGTLAYSSPERCMGGPTGFKSDIWSLGCLLYELVELKPLFPAKSLAELVMSITQVRFEQIQRVDIQPGVRNLFMLMIARQPNDRPTASELVYITDNLLLKAQRAGATPAARCQPRVAGVDPNGKLDGRHLNKQPAAPQMQPPPPQALSYPHSLVYQVKLSSRDVQVDRVHLPQSKRIKEMAKGRAHYLVLTHDNIVYGWGARHCGQLGACSGAGTSSTSNLLGAGATRSGARHTRSARNSFTAKDFAATPSAADIGLTTPTTKRLPGGGGNGGHLSLTQPSSLASSTQTLNVGTGSGPQQRADSAGNETRPLADAPPTSRPFIVGELNRRKIVRVVAGNDFSVFLSKTGIVMTCGDGSRGCLGRGELASSQTPCMVDALLSMDVVGVACGPEHVVAVCGNGQAYVWGNSRHGRLGLSAERIARGASGLGHLVVVPQPVEFPRPGVIIKSAYCGDKCTVFLDSQHNCWACGENTSNRLGLDVRRRFKRTLLVERAWQPARIASLSVLTGNKRRRHKIISCQLAENHASYLTSEGKMLIMGQDIDRSYKLRSDLATASGLRPTTTYLRANSRVNNRPELRAPLRKLITRLLVANRLNNFKLIDAAQQQQHKVVKLKVASRGFCELPKLTRQQRRAIEIYLKKSRASRRFPFEGVLSVACTSKFTLALTNDNRVYFWGARTHDKDDEDAHRREAVEVSRNNQTNLHKPLSIEPQLAANSHDDECFIKIGATNNSLMSSIQLIGSDQPILHARNPQLRADSLTDLWILDYEPPTSSSCASSCSSCSASSCQDCSCDTASPSISSCDSISSCQSSQRFKRLNERQRRHDAILEPQPIISLYVPPTFGYNNSLIQLVNLFCFDEDRFFLILDTTVKLASTSAGPSVSRPTSRRGSLSLKQLAQSPAAPTAAAAAHHHESLPVGGISGGSQLAQQVAAAAAAQATTSRLNIVEESSDSQQRQQMAPPGGVVTPNQPGLTTLECCQRVADDEQEQRLFDSAAATEAFDPTGHNLKVELFNGTVIGCSVTPPPSVMSVHTNFSLEEPRSMSTFAPNFTQRHLMVRAPSLGDLTTNDQEQDDDDDEDDEPVMRKLSFERSGQSFGPSYLLGQHGKKSRLERRRRRGRGRRRRTAADQQSESTAVTMEPDDTSSMPTWVRNEYLQQLSSSGASSPDDVTQQQPLSVSDQSEASTCQDEEQQQDEETCVGANELELTVEDASQAEPTEKTHYGPSSMMQAEQLEDDGLCDIVAARLSADNAGAESHLADNNSISSHSEFSISTAIGVERRISVEFVVAKTGLHKVDDADGSSGSSCSIRSQVESVRLAGLELAHRDHGHLCRSQSNISTVNKWSRLPGHAEDLARTSDQLDLARGSGGGGLGGGTGRTERMAENLLECGVYKTVNANEQRACSSSGSSTTSLDQDELHNHHDAYHARREPNLAGVDDGASSPVDEQVNNMGKLTRQTIEEGTPSWLSRPQQHRAQLLSQSASCLPIQERYTRLSASISHESNDDNAQLPPPPPEVVFAQSKKSGNKTGSRASLTSMRKSLVRIFC